MGSASSDSGLTASPLLKLLRAAFAVRASDIHLKPGVVPMFRIDGELRPVEFPAVDLDELELLCAQLARRSIEELRGIAQQEFSYELSGIGRFRGHYYQRMGQPAVALRPIPLDVPTPSELRLPAAVKRFVDLSQGLVLVTGATGMGKSTTLACIVALIAQTTCRHIVTIEDPVEYIIPDGRSFLTQREVGRDVRTFQEGLRAALRQDPDVLLIGEIRERETMEVALHAALSGHLVLSSAHFMDTTAAVNGMIALADPREQVNWRFRLAEALRAIITQRLLPRRGSPGRVLATEVLLNEPMVRACIQDETKTKNIRTALERGKADYQTHSMDQCLIELLETKLITLDVAQGAATSPGDLTREVNLRRIGA